MKLRILLALLIAIITQQTTYAQTELWGMSSDGGKYGVGTIFKTDGDGNNFEIQHSFFKTVGKTVTSPLTETSNGKLYGLASEDGICSDFAGVIYEYNIDTDSYEIKYTFEDTENGNYPEGRLIYASNGKLYGITKKGGTSDNGVLFEFDPATNTYSKIHDFDNTNGRMPKSVMQADNGKLYGVANYGGENDEGVIFEFDLSTSTFTNLFDFDGSNGEQPVGTFIETSSGKLFGMTYGGGSSNYGTIYEYDIDAKSHHIKVNLNIYDANIGGKPKGGLVISNNGKLYGVLDNGGYNKGFLFEYDIDSEVYTKKIDFLGYNGENPVGDLLLATDGKLYGMTSDGGSDKHGTIFEFDTASETLIVRYNFINDDNSGYYPQASLMKASNGKLYSATYNGGESLWEGGLFEFDITTYNYSKKFDFEVSKLGSNPNGDLLQANNGILYGMTSHGGTYIDSDYTNDRYGAGTIFEFNPSTSSHKVLFNFDGTNGNIPQGSLIQASNNKLYGVTISGGTKNWGVLFEYDIDTGIQTVKVNFDSNDIMGAYPYGDLLQAKNGKLYGVTSRGGTNGKGVFYEYNIDTDKLEIVKEFTGTDGAYAIGNIIQAQDDLLYGMTPRGGTYDRGILFAYNTTLETFTKKHDFLFKPYGSLTETTNGKLIAIAYGVDGDKDVIFEYDSTSETVISIADFDDTHEASNGSFLQASNGKLYGHGSIESTDYKFLFEFDVNDKVIVPKVDFTCKKNTSSILYISTLIEIDANYLAKEKQIFPTNILLYPNPAINEINIINSTNNNVDISIYDSLGKLIISTSSNDDVVNIDISKLTKGVYFVRTKDENGVGVAKIIKK